jgi:hypothetical protein
MCFVNSDLCHLQHKLIGFITDLKSVYSAVRTGPLNKAVCAPSLKGCSFETTTLPERRTKTKTIEKSAQWNEGRIQCKENVISKQK